ncbi:unnamed protein product, partial [marine sediment metagenome]
MKKVKIRSSRLRNHLKPILDEWIKIIDGYSNNVKDDALYWHNEMASVSSLAGAIWRQKDHLAIEEYVTEKRTKRKGKKWNGRGDLYFRCGRTDYIAEAKQKEVSISSTASKTIDHIKEALDNALDDVEAAHPAGGETPLGVVFVVPYIPLSGKNQKASLINQFIDEISDRHSDLDYDAMAYTFPKNGST